MQILEMPYAERQLIVVVDDQVVEVARTRATSSSIIGKVDWGEVLKKSLHPFSSPLITLGIELVKAARDQGVNMFPVSRSESATLQFPPGHPRDSVLYIGHPSVPKIYYPAAQFHRRTFEHKLNEAIKLLMGLGAIEINVEHDSGWGREFSANLNLPIGQLFGATVGGGGGAKKKRHLLFQISLDLEGTTNPSVPYGLVWYDHEPTWRQIAEGRIKYGLKNFDLSLRYEDDFGVNADLAVMIENLKLDLGGKFEDHKSTVWNIQVKFR